MTSTKRDPILVVIQLTGGNDSLNTLIPYGDSLYYENRNTVAVPREEVIAIDGIMDSTLRCNLSKIYMMKVK